MSRDHDRIAADIACLNVRDLPLTLVSTAGFHCDVWRSAGVIVSGAERRAVDFVLKRCKRPCRLPEVAVLGREHAVLRRELEDLVPQAVFVATAVNGRPGVVVLAETCTPWFDLGNPGNEDEALPLLAHHPRARGQLERFVAAARRWFDEEEKIIDLCGVENLVLDRDYRVRYLDSFHVFFYLDVLHVIDEVDDGLTHRVEQSVRRLEYLERVVARLAGDQSGATRATGAPSGATE